MNKIEEQINEILKKFPVANSIFCNKQNLFYMSENILYSWAGKADIKMSVHLNYCRNLM